MDKAWFSLICISAFLPSIAPTPEFSPFLDESEANSFLSRNKRSNSLFEEFYPGDQERECIEEMCTREEAYEVFDDAKKGRQYWEKYTRCTQSIVYKDNSRNLTPQGRARIRISRQAGISARDIKDLRDCVSDTDQCNPFPCVRGNTESCEDRINGFECFCKPGFQGKKCEHHINECLSSPCGSFGTCEDEIGGFQCHCDEIHEGIHCEKEITDCRIFGCGSHGECLLGEGYACVCDIGFAGDECDQDIDECLESPCDHTCTNTQGSFSCSCDAGYILDLKTRTECKDIDECTVTTPGCQDFCVNTPGSFNCTCRKGYKLDSVFQRYCNDIDECEMDNGGCPIIASGCGLERAPCKTCINREGEYYCTCPIGFRHYVKGQDCEDINECVDGRGRNCEHECENFPGGYRCYCREGYKLNYNRENCVDINECIEDHGCEHRCANKPGTYECKCQRGYELDEGGLRCQDFDECKAGKNHCKHDCLNTDGSYTCTCKPGYNLSGRYLCTEINECLSNPCGMNGRCINEVNSFRCECNDGFSGDLCEISIDPCTPNPCLNGVCNRVDDGFSCRCMVEFSGPRCEIHTIPIIPECDEGYERNDGECVDIDECQVSSPCDQRCENTQGSYLCRCGDGFLVRDDNCEDVDECAQEACQQLCQNSQGSFQCNCTEGYTLSVDGRSCTENVACVGANFPTLGEDHVLLGTKKSDFVDSEIQSMSSSKFTLDFEFRTYDPDGVLFAMSSEDAQRYIFAEISGGNLVFAVNLDGIHKESKSEGQSTADGKWHRVISRESHLIVARR